MTDIRDVFLPFLLNVVFLVGMSRFGQAEASGGVQGQTKSDVGPLKWMSYVSASTAHLALIMYLSFGCRPESLLDKVYSNKSDVWAFGCVIYEVYAREGTFVCLFSSSDH
jgi:hypothetical protein